MESDPFIKIIVVGEQGVGKTCLLNQFCYQKFESCSAPTIGCDFTTKVTSLGGKTVRLQLWDVAGQEKYNSVSKLYVRGALGCVIVADICDEQSLMETLKWKQIVEENCDLIDGKGIPIILVQNKLDLVDQSTLQPFQKLASLQEFANKQNFLSALQTSAKDGTGLKELFQKLIQEIMDRGLIQGQKSNFSKLTPGADGGENSTIKLTTQNQGKQQEKQGGCC